MKIGFSTGCLYKTHDNLAKETFALFRNVGCNAIEVMWHEGIETPKLLNLKKEDFNGFKYISIHAPAFEHFNEVEVVQMLDTLMIAHKEIGFESVVLHPYETMNWEIFKRYDLPFMIENMDWRKVIGKYVESLEDIFSKLDVPMVLDVNHCMTNDPSMRLAYDLAEKFESRIKEIHLSGFETFHELLYKTQQKEILDAIPNRELPIIIESGCENIEDVINEYKYVKKYFEEKQ